MLLSIVAKQAAIALEYWRAEDARGRLQRERDELLDRLSVQFDRMPIACIVSDPQHQIVDWNPAALKIFGYRREEVVGKSDDLLLVPLSRREHAREIDRLLASGETTAHGTSDNVTKDGRIIVCDWHHILLRNAHGKVTAILAMAHDVTERTQNETRLRRNEALLAEAEQLAHIGSWSWDIASGTVIWSDETYRIFGMRPQEVEMTRERFLSYIHPDDRITLQNEGDRMLRDHQVSECCLRAAAPGRNRAGRALSSTSGAR